MIDRRPDKAQTVAMISSVPPEHGTAGGGVGLTPSSPRPRQGRRRPPNPTEQARRKAWGAEWGAVGHWWKVTHPEEGR